MSKTARMALSLVLAILSAAGAAAAGPMTVGPGIIDKDTAWEGPVRVDGFVTVAPGATLTVKPASVVSFARGAGLNVEGGLVAEGTAAAPIRFVSGEAAPSPGDWAGIAFRESRGRAVLSRCSISHAAAVNVEKCDPQIRDCDIALGVVGIAVARSRAAVLAGNVVREMSQGGVRCEFGASPAITGNTIKACKSFGIVASQDSAPVVTENIVSECGTGINLFGDGPPVERNVCRKNKVGFSITQAGLARAIRGNRFRENGTGLLCWQFSGPAIERNEFTGNDIGLACVRSSSPLVRNNEISKNAQGISCDRLCRPRIVANEIRGNGKGIYLTFSSYAIVNGNNIHENGIQFELGNMSSDWEAQVGKKPERGRQARTATRMGRGLAGPQEIAQGRGDGAVIMGSVDAAGNWWGERDTAEMEKKGPDANITGLVDYYDVPTRAYEGYPGEYVQDRIKYDGWKKTRIGDAGIR